MIRARMSLSIGLVSLSCFLGACMHWQALSPQTAAPFTLDSNQTYRFRLASGDTKVISHPHTEGDSMAWGEQVSAGTYWRFERRTLPLSEIRSVAVQRPDPGSSIAFLVIGVLSLGMLIEASGAQSLQGLHF